LCKLCLSRSIYGANVCASAALDASVSVDNVLTVTLSNCIYRALTLACAAGDALIVNYICHEKILLFILNVNNSDTVSDIVFIIA
jgi:hypothetical protein